MQVSKEEFLRLSKSAGERWLLRLALEGLIEALEECEADDQ
jgi:hypothetical protein